MKDWRKTLISPDISIMEAIKKIDSGSMQVAAVVDENNRLLGMVTDGDVRRGLLRGLKLTAPVREIMNRQPTVASISQSKESILALMKMKFLHQIPVVDADRCIVGIDIMYDLVQAKKEDNWIVIMAGGLGSRLSPLTDQCPKPLLQIGGKPILETIVENFATSGFRKIFLSVNYKASMIEEHFGDGSKWNVDISYIREQDRLGTAGALGMLPGRPDKPLIIMNGDLLTKVNFAHLLNFHAEHKACGTMCVREYNFQVPYGVVKLENHRLLGIDEKPVQHFFVSAGIYVLNPQVLDLIPANTYIDMPMVFDELLKQEKETAVFPVREYWLDIGRMSDFDRANCEYGEVFDNDR